uniref:General secretion pathway protein K / Type II secretory pathway, component PulK n=1 Tax=Rheinheimera sp. BAL341 TaxID=1708203 RepID=A0A486XV54_9GAMM
MVSIISILLLLAVGFAQQSLRQTQQVQEALQQRLALYSAVNNIQLKLLTSHWYDQSQLGDINFYAHPFRYNLSEDSPELTVTLQDQNGLLDIRYPFPEIARVLQHFEIDATRANRLVSSLRAQQQTAYDPLNTNRFRLQLQSFAELANLPGWNIEILDKIKPFITLNGGTFNPAQAPDELLAILLPPSQSAIIRQWREEGQFTIRNFSALTGIVEDEIVQLHPGDTVLLTVKNQYGLQLQRLVKLSPYLNEPVIYYRQSYTPQQ